MVREHSVRIKELAAADISAERFKYICRIETAYTVSCIYNDLETLERMMIIVLGIYFLLYHFAEHICIAAHEITFYTSAALCSVRLLSLLSICKDSFDILAVKTALTGKEFQTVAIIWMMACSDLNSAVT